MNPDMITVELTEDQIVALVIAAQYFLQDHNTYRMAVGAAMHYVGGHGVVRLGDDLDLQDEIRHNVYDGCSQLSSGIQTAK